MGATWKVGEVRHMVLDIEGALRWPKRKLRGMLTRGGRTLTIDETHAALCQMLRDGRQYLPMGCPTPTETGECPGHMPDAAPHDGARGSE